MKIYNARSFVILKEKNYIDKNKKYVIPVFLKYKDRKKYLLDFFGGKQPIIKWKNKYYKIISSEESECNNCNFYNKCFDNKSSTSLCSISYIFNKLNCTDLLFKEIEEYEAFFIGD